MPYVNRDSDGKIVARFARRQYPEQEWVDEKDLKKDLTLLREQKANEIKAAFHSELLRGFTCSNGIKMDCAANAIQMFKLVVESETSSKITVRDYNNQLHTVTLDEAKQMVDELTDHLKSLLNKKWDLEDKIQKKRSKKTIEAITW